MPRRPDRRPCSADPLCPYLGDGGPCRQHQQRARTTDRGYGGAHQRIRTELEARHPNGPCGRCGRRGAWDDELDPLTAGHIDHDGPTVLANYQPEHRSCGNREALDRRHRSHR